MFNQEKFIFIFLKHPQKTPIFTAADDVNFQTPCVTSLLKKYLLNFDYVNDTE